MILTVCYLPIKFTLYIYGAILVIIRNAMGATLISLKTQKPNGITRITNNATRARNARPRIWNAPFALSRQSVSDPLQD